ncbi:MAB_1171c family putative transporter [Microtetraspora malaysiensis]|uniref:MAB_1171c family putative transporter n=1 Tax=Microtetraspora malaysiensis TaxID=161358 RepID=UPI0008300722|nr:MAB_1171c family putative transporter [Microtetraspora malaysiensis]
MLQWLNYCACGLAVGVAGYKLFRVRRDQRALGLHYLAAFFLCLGLAMAAMAHPTLDLVSRYEPMPNTARFVGNALEMAAAYFLGALGHSIAIPEHTKRWLRRYGIILAGAVTLMAVLLIAAETTYTRNFVNVYSNSPLVVGYLAVFFLYITVCVVAFMRTISRYVPHAETTTLRVGLQFVVAGAAVGIIWAGWSGVRPVITLLTGQSLATVLPIGTMIGVTCILLWLIGATLTAWGTWLAAPLRWVRAFIRHRQMDPLWRALRAARPQIALIETAKVLWDTEFALYRRVIEIRDAQLTLRPYAHPAVPQWVGPAADPATLEAAVIAASLIGYAAGRNYNAEHPFHDVDPSITSESAWLVRVSREFTKSAVVARVRERATAEAEHSTP